HTEHLAGPEVEVDVAQHVPVAVHDAQAARREDRAHLGRGGTGIEPFTWVSVTCAVAISMLAFSACSQPWPRVRRTPPRSSRICFERSTSTSGASAWTPRTSAETPPEPRAQLTWGVVSNFTSMRGQLNK